jgi:hypothetical protein
MNKMLDSQQNSTQDQPWPTQIKHFQLILNVSYIASCYCIHSIIQSAQSSSLSRDSKKSAPFNLLDNKETNKQTNNYEMQYSETPNQITYFKKREWVVTARKKKALITKYMRERERERENMQTMTNLKRGPNCTFVVCLYLYVVTS